MTFYSTFKLKTRNLLLVFRVLAKKHVIQAYYQKIDFIEKTNDELSIYVQFVSVYVQSTVAYMHNCTSFMKVYNMLLTLKI